MNLFKKVIADLDASSWIAFSVLGVIILVLVTT